MDQEKELLARAKAPTAEAMRLHPFYRGKVEISLKSPVRNSSDFAIWYTPGVAGPCEAIAGDKEQVYRYTNKGNCVAVVSDGTRVLGLGDICLLYTSPHRRRRRPTLFHSYRANNQVFSLFR